jgi:5-formyltetrahydrofolate cyclo-ligase
VSFISRHNAISQLKAKLRSEAAAKRRGAWSRSNETASNAVAARGLEFVSAQKTQEGAVVSGYYPIRDELDCLPLLRALHRLRFGIGLPKTSRPLALKFKAWTPDAPLTIGKFGLSEPSETAPDVMPSIVFVPLLGFDRHGNRLGYGAGYYDAALSSLRTRRSIVAAGIAFDEQEFESLPREPHDEPLDFILTPTRTLRAGAG